MEEEGKAEEACWNAADQKAEEGLWRSHVPGLFHWVGQERLARLRRAGWTPLHLGFVPGVMEGSGLSGEQLGAWRKRLLQVPSRVLGKWLLSCCRLYYPIHLAVLHRASDMAFLMLSRCAGAQLTLPCGAHRNATPAHLAVLRGSPAVLEGLLSLQRLHGVDLLSCTDSQGATPVSLAIQHRRSSCLAVIRRLCPASLLPAGLSDDEVADDASNNADSGDKKPLSSGDSSRAEESERSAVERMRAEARAMQMQLEMDQQRLAQMRETQRRSNEELEMAKQRIHTQADQLRKFLARSSSEASLSKKYDDLYKAYKQQQLETHQLRKAKLAHDAALVALSRGLEEERHARRTLTSKLTAEQDTRKADREEFDRQRQRYDGWRRASDELQEKLMDTTLRLAECRRDLEEANRKLQDQTRLIQIKKELDSSSH